MCTVAAERTFTLKELARVVRAAPGARGTDGVVAASAMAAKVPDVRDYDDDLDDPVGLSESAYEKMYPDVESDLAVLLPVFQKDVP
jgi:hypothetical protein